VTCAPRSSGDDTWNPPTDVSERCDGGTLQVSDEAFRNRLNNGMTGCGGWGGWHVTTVCVPLFTEDRLRGRRKGHKLVHASHEGDNREPPT
jgi:hypothetical protein